MRRWWSSPWSSRWSSSWGLRYLPFGRRLFAIGSNPDAARVAGFPVQRDVFAAFALSGALSGLAGFMFLARFGNITVTAGQGLELQVVAAVVVGGVNIFGGVGSIIGAFLGAMLIELLQQSLIRWAEVSEFVRDAILGLLILVAVASRQGDPRPAPDDVGPRTTAGRRTSASAASGVAPGGVTWRPGSARGRACCSSS